RRRAVVEDTLAAPDDHGELEQAVLVDEAGVVQRLHQLPAAVHLQLVAGAFLERPDRSDDVLGDDADRVAPLRVGERGGDHVLRARVERRSDVVIGVGDLWPVAGHELVGGPSVEQLGGRAEPAVDDPAEVLVHERHDPPATVEAAARVLRRGAGSLHDAVERDELVHGELYVGSSRSILDCRHMDPDYRRNSAGGRERGRRTLSDAPAPLLGYDVRRSPRVSRRSPFQSPTNTSSPGRPKDWTMSASPPLIEFLTW